MHDRRALMALSKRFDIGGEVEGPEVIEPGEAGLVGPGKKARRGRLAGRRDLLGNGKALSLDSW